MCKKIIEQNPRPHYSLSTINACRLLVDTMNNELHSRHHHRQPLPTTPTPSTQSKRRYQQRRLKSKSSSQFVIVIVTTIINNPARIHRRRRRPTRHGTASTRPILRRTELSHCLRRLHRRIERNHIRRMHLAQRPRYRVLHTGSIVGMPPQFDCRGE